MKFIILVSSFLLVCHLQASSQRISRIPQTTSTSTYSAPFSGRLFNVTLTNDGADSILLKLSPSKKIKNNDTLNLSRTYHCNNSLFDEHYDLDNTYSQISSCVNWYTLQLIKPGDSLHFVVKLGDFDLTDTARLYFFFTNSFTKIDREVEMHRDPRKIYMMKEERNFLANYVILEKNMSGITLAICHGEK
jgi:hypothetical protein